MRATSVMTGGDIARCAIDVRLGGPDARVDLDGLYLPTGRQRHDNVVTVDHAASAVHEHPAVQRHRRRPWPRLVQRPRHRPPRHHRHRRPPVEPQPGAVPDRPGRHPAWLEILADDVRCTHGATVGRLDDDALFYLRSRGIPLAQGRAMLVAAFAAEIIDDHHPAVAARPVAGRRSTRVTRRRRR